MDDTKSHYIESNETLVANEQYNNEEPPRYSFIGKTYSYVNDNLRYVFAIITAIIVILILYNFSYCGSKPTQFISGFLGSQKGYCLDDRISNLNALQNKNLQYLCSQ
jgi:hypothetical protein